MMIKNCRIRNARAGDARALAAIHVRCWRATYKGLIPQAYLDQMGDGRTDRAMHRGLLDPGNDYLVAEGQQGPVGYICGGPERSQDPVYLGEIYELYVLSTYQAQGLGKQLLSAMAHRLYRKKLYSLVVWVLAGNPNRSFYEKCNGIYLRTQSITFAGTKLAAAAYGWIDATLAMSGPL
jgi:ribosomal protein S18 acetylase RimI-like enzyme